jgi:hypothetical protein
LEGHLGMDTRPERAPAGVYITACMHEADLPKGRIAFAAPVL